MKGWIFAGALVALTASQALAQDVADYISITPVPGWVVAVDAPAAVPESGRELSRALTDYQARHDFETDAYFVRRVLDLDSSAGVEDAGTLSVDFDPSYETLELHHINILRNGERIEGIDLSEAMVFRTETDRDQLIFNGTMTFSMPVLGLRVGDRLDYAYTQSGRNPAIGAHFLSRRSFATQNDIARRHTRVLVPSDMDVHTAAFNDLPAPDVTQVGQWTVRTWDAPDPAVNDYDSDVPSWAYTRPTFEMSSLESWGAVGELFAPRYTLDAGDRAAVSPIVAEIEAEAGNDPARRARLALDWVQKNIRYVGIEVGEGGYVPRPPARVLKRRFGDCKDVTLLLLALLDGLGVQGDGLLVNTGERGGEFDGLPHPYAFNHVVVVAEVNGALHVMDATRDPQLGTLATMEQGHYRRGLRLREGASRVLDLPGSDYPVRELIEESFDLEGSPDTIRYDFALTEYGEDADATFSWFARSGQEGVQQDMVDYLRTRFPTLEVTEPLEVTFDEPAARSQIRMGLTLEKSDALRTRLYQTLADVPKFDGADRRSPFAITHPSHIRHVRRYVGDSGYSFNTRDKTLETDSFVFRAEDRTEDSGQTLVEDYVWRTKRDHIPTESFAEEMDIIDDIRDLSYTTITLGGDNADSDDEPIFGAMGSLGLLLLIGGAGVWFVRRFNA